MSQTLTALTALSTPVKLTDSNTLIKDLAAVENLAPSQLKAIAILGMIYSCDSSNGTTYKTHHATVIQYAKTFMGGLSLLDQVGVNKQVDALMAVLAWSAGHSADATLSADVNTLLKEARDFLAVPEEALNRIFWFLFYALTV